MDFDMDGKPKGTLEKTPSQRYRDSLGGRLSLAAREARRHGVQVTGDQAMQLHVAQAGRCALTGRSFGQGAERVAVANLAEAPDQEPGLVLRWLAKGIWEMGAHRVRRICRDAVNKETMGTRSRADEVFRS